MHSGTLRPCPSTPNCVSSEAGTPPRNQIAPLTAPRGASDLTRLGDLLAAWPRTVVVTSRRDYVHAECASRVFGFTDDLEFRLDADASVIHVRSKARLGRGDFGVNRKRIEALRVAFERR
ncbi:MAG TPA: DUF1499 domain-containing protein [Gemmatimonadaceae bacterium]|nr:DUF1499 domain-containing protein [Gemmatimonadaceae bacterium]